MTFTGTVRRATPADAGLLAVLLHDFNTEFDAATPGPTVLAARLTRLLGHAAPSDSSAPPTSPASPSSSALPGPSTQPAPPAPIAAGATTALLAEQPRGGVIGLALVTWHTSVWHDGPVALLDELYVVPEHRGSGAGSALITALLSDAAQSNAGAIELGVDEPDVDALRFYRRHGFTETSSEGDRSFYISREL